MWYPRKPLKPHGAGVSACPGDGSITNNYSEALLQRFSYLLFVVLIAAFLGGCAHPNFAGLEGNALNSRYGLEDKRKAVLAIKVTDTVPSNAAEQRKLWTQRCHQYLTSERPSEDTLKDDLIMAAYAQGYDGLTGFSYSTESGLLRNCWTVHKASATAFKLPGAK